MKRLLLIAIIVLIASGCGKKKSPNPGGGSGNTPPPSPTQANLKSPDNNAVCTTGVIKSAVESDVTFTWSESDHTDSYELDLVNLITKTPSQQTTAGTSLTVTLLRNTPYSWQVLSKNTSTSSVGKSDTWRFYISGNAIINYAPFPAALITPAFGESVTATGGKINLAWSGSDVDNDIVSYDVYLGDSNSPGLQKSGVTDTFLNDVNVTSGKTYYWKVITKDSQKNTSDSGVFQFTVK